MTITTRYGPLKYYGSPLVYGEGAATGLLAWAIEIDWDNDGVFDGSNEAFRMTNFDMPLRGRKKMLKKAGQGFEVIAPGTCVITLKNGDGRYDQFNTASPLYPYVQTGVDARVRITDQATGTSYNILRGVVYDIQPNTIEKTVKIYVAETTSYLTKNTARVAVTTGIAPETAIGAVLNYMNWPTRWGRNLDTTGDVIPYYWANGNKLALSEIQDIAQSFFGWFFADNQGRARFIKRTAISASVADYTQEQCLKDMGNATLYDNYRNVTRMKIHPRLLSTLTTLYQLQGNKPVIHPGSTNKEEIWGNYTYNNSASPATSVVTPVAGLANDYAFNSLADGSGTDYTSSVTVTFTDLGDTCKFMIANNAGVDVYCIKLQVRGYAVHEQNSSDLTYPVDVTTITNQRELKVDLLWLQDINIARDLANVVGFFIASLHPTPVIQIEGRPDIQFTADLFDIVTATAPALGIGGISFRVSGISHKTLVDTCQSVRTTIYLEPYISGSSFWIWPVTDFGVDTVFGW
jgi:hypothetical protein